MEIIKLLFKNKKTPKPNRIHTFENNTFIWSSLQTSRNTLIQPVRFTSFMVESDLFSLYSWWTKAIDQNLTTKHPGKNSDSDVLKVYVPTWTIACALLVLLIPQWKSSIIFSHPVTAAAVQNPYGFVYTWTNTTNSFWLVAKTQEAVNCMPCSASIQMPQFGLGPSESIFVTIFQQR